MSTRHPATVSHLPAEHALLIGTVLASTVGALSRIFGGNALEQPMVLAFGLIPHAAFGVAASLLLLRLRREAVVVLVAWILTLPLDQLLRRASPSAPSGIGDMLLWTGSLSTLACVLACVWWKRGRSSTTRLVPFPAGHRVALLFALGTGLLLLAEAATTGSETRELSAVVLVMLVWLFGLPWGLRNVASVRTPHRDFGAWFAAFLTIFLLTPSVVSFLLWERVLRAVAVLLELSAPDRSTALAHLLYWPSGFLAYLPTLGLYWGFSAFYSVALLNFRTSLAERSRSPSRVVADGFVLLVSLSLVLTFVALVGLIA